MKKADSTTNIIMWMGVILSVIIVALWFMTMIRPVQFDTDRVNKDLTSVRVALDAACSSLEYVKRYNPVTERGTMLFNETHTCINTTVYRCQENPCPIQQPASFVLADITTIIIEKGPSIIILSEEEYTGAKI